MQNENAPDIAPPHPLFCHCYSERQRRKNPVTIFNAVIPLRGVTLGFSHARINSVATLSLRVIPTRASPERSRMGAGITFLHCHLEHRERFSYILMNR